MTHTGSSLAHSCRTRGVPCTRTGSAADTGWRLASDDSGGRGRRQGCMPRPSRHRPSRRPKHYRQSPLPPPPPLPPPSPSPSPPTEGEGTAQIQPSSALGFTSGMALVSRICMTITRPFRAAQALRHTTTTPPPLLPARHHAQQSYRARPFPVPCARTLRTTSRHLHPLFSPDLGLEAWRREPCGGTNLAHWGACAAAWPEWVSVASRKIGSKLCCYPAEAKSGIAATTQQCRGSHFLAAALTYAGFSAGVEGSERRRVRPPLPCVLCRNAPGGPERFQRLQDTLPASQAHANFLTRLRLSPSFALAHTRVPVIPHTHCFAPPTACVDGVCASKLDVTGGGDKVTVRKCDLDVDDPAHRLGARRALRAVPLIYMCVASTALPGLGGGWCPAPPQCVCGGGCALPLRAFSPCLTPPASAPHLPVITPRKRLGHPALFPFPSRIRYSMSSRCPSFRGGVVTREWGSGSAVRGAVEKARGSRGAPAVERGEGMLCTHLTGGAPKTSAPHAALIPPAHALVSSNPRLLPDAASIGPRHATHWLLNIGTTVIPIYPLRAVACVCICLRGVMVPRDGRKLRGEAISPSTRLGPCTTIIIRDEIRGDGYRRGGVDREERKRCGGEGGCSSAASVRAGTPRCLATAQLQGSNDDKRREEVMEWELDVSSTIPKWVVAVFLSCASLVTWLCSRFVAFPEWKSLSILGLVGSLAKKVTCGDSSRSSESESRTTVTEPSPPARQRTPALLDVAHLPSLTPRSRFRRRAPRYQCHALASASSIAC
ncbi:hypothetical protein B0H11DRAFT_2364963 [Mycena galericulata]|nr:hypothetical protein B0H11DRAFT_2364963 [Mycena galericulata]